MGRPRKSDMKSNIEVALPAPNTQQMEAIAKLCYKIKADGFVPADDLREEFGDDVFTRSIAILYRTLRVLREVRRPWKDGHEVLGYEWADRRFSKKQEATIPPGFGFVLELVSNGRPKYGDYKLVVSRCRWTNHILGAIPSGNDLNVFDRDGDDMVLIRRYNLRAMASTALPFIGKERAIARRIGWSAIRIPGDKVSIRTEAKINEMGQGCGLCRSEMLPAGTEFVVKALVPTSVILEADFLEMLRVAGEYVGLSPARSSGFGEFEVISAK